MSRIVRFLALLSIFTLLLMQICLHANSQNRLPFPSAEKSHGFLSLIAKYTLTVPEELRKTEGKIAESLSDESYKPSAESLKFSRKLVSLTNAERLKRGLMPLKFQMKLNEIAGWFARDMSDFKYFQHTDRLNREAGERAIAFKYEDWDRLGENIAQGYSTPEEVFEGWLKSPHHMLNILGKDFTEVGFGFAKPGNSSTTYWVQEFGRRTEIHPLIVNLDDEATPEEKVSLHIHGEGWAKEMRLRCDDTGWTEWKLFCNLCPWKLCNTKKKHLIQVELRSGDEVRQSEATIEIIPENLLVKTAH